MDLKLHPLQAQFDLLYKEMANLYRKAALADGISDSAQIILYTVCELGDGCLQKDICDRSFLTKQTVHSSVQKLERDGFLLLRPGKGRDRHLSLTEQGRALAERTVLPLAAAKYRAMEALSPREQADLLRLTGQYAAALRTQLRQR